MSSASRSGDDRQEVPQKAGRNSVKELILSFNKNIEQQSSNGELEWSKPSREPPKTTKHGQERITNRFSVNDGGSVFKDQRNSLANSFRAAVNSGRDAVDSTSSKNGRLSVQNRARIGDSFLEKVNAAGGSPD